MFSDNTIIMLYFVIVLYTLILVRYLLLYETLVELGPGNGIMSSFYFSVVKSDKDLCVALLAH